METISVLLAFYDGYPTVDSCNKITLTICAMNMTVVTKIAKLTKSQTFVGWWSQYWSVIWIELNHYNDVIMSAMASQITSLTIVYSSVYSDADQLKYQSSASLAFVWGIQRWPVNSPHKGPVTRKIFLFDDVIMCYKSIFRMSCTRLFRRRSTPNGRWYFNSPPISAPLIQ